MKTENLDAEIKRLKSLGQRVQKADIAGITFIYTSFLRSDWKAFQKLLAQSSQEITAKDPDGIGVKEAGEDLIVSHKLISPTPTPELIASLAPGVITALAELILKASGFGQNEPVVEEL